MKAAPVQNVWIVEATGQFGCQALMVFDTAVGAEEQRAKWAREGFMTFKWSLCERPSANRLPAEQRNP